jgi:hypothetical protein
MQEYLTEMYFVVNGIVMLISQDLPYTVDYVVEIMESL